MDIVLPILRVFGRAFLGLVSSLGILLGGLLSLGPLGALFDALGTFSKREDEPSKASRPFDRGRDGLVPSGGAAALILESESHLKARGGQPLAEVRGYGFSSDGEHLTLPSGGGARRAMQMALGNA